MAASQAWHYSFGEWTEGPDPVDDAWGEDQDQAQAMEALGFTEINRVGTTEYGTCIEVWQRRQPSPRHVICLSTDSVVDRIYVMPCPTSGTCSHAGRRSSATNTSSA